MQHLRSAREIRMMRQAGLLVWQAHQEAAKLVKAGVQTLEIDAAITAVFSNVEAEPLFLGYPGPTPFPAATCISVNEEVVHGIPGNRKLAAGDIVSIDTGCRYHGWCGDAAVTHAVGEISPTNQRLLDATSGVLDLAIRLMEEKSYWREVAKEMQAFIHDHGFSVIEDYVGHAIGREMHESPQVPNYYDPKHKEGSHDFQLRPGIVVAIEPMVNVGTKKTRVLEDKWTVVTADGKPSAHFEHTVALTKEGAIRLTAAPGDGESVPSEP